MNSQERKEYMREYKKAYYQAHKEQAKAYYQANKEQCKAQMKAYYESHKEQHKARVKAYYQSHREQYNAYNKSYKKADVNSLGQTKHSIRMKSRQIRKQMNLHIDGYEIHHCFGYEDPSKFIYVSRSLHRKIHQYLREHNIDASNDHWMAIRDLVNDTDEFTYIKC